MNIEQDKRTHSRKALHSEAAVADVLGNTWTKVQLLDISQSGVALLSTEEYSVGASRMLRFHLPGYEGQLSVLCRIVHCAQHSYLEGFRVGTAFVRIGEIEAGAIAAFMA